MYTQINHHISQVTGAAFAGVPTGGVGGGCISRADRLVDPKGGDGYFVKTHQASMSAMFETEMAGLLEIGATNTVRVPRPLCCGTTEGMAYLVLEWLDLGGGDQADWGKLGTQLAQMHRATQQDYGWSRDNFIGATVQKNTPNANWAQFFSQTRLAFQVELARSKGARFPLFEELQRHLPNWLDHQVRPSLVHGDLWSGNAAFARGEPVIYDVAVYYGDREVDLAMSRLFGGFPDAFYQAYSQSWPLPPGSQQRQTLYNLYHVLNHYNLFGGHYQQQAHQMMASLLQ